MAKAATTTDDQDALELLKRDHREVEQLFRKYQQAGEENEKAALAERVCLMLKVHTRIEEELFYPALRGKLDDELLNEAQVEHDSAKELIGRIESGDADDAMIDAEMAVLQEQIQHHVREEENEMFPEVRKIDLDLVGLGAKLAERKMSLMAELSQELEIEAEPRSFLNAAERDEEIEREAPSGGRRAEDQGPSARR